MSMSVNSVIQSYTYTYQNKLRPRLDKNDDAAWDRSEVENYARDYSQATGKSIDVDKLYEDYDSDGDGVFNASEYEQIISADALGMDTLAKLRIEQQTQTEPATGTETPAATGKPDLESLNKLINDYAYQYSGKLTPKLDGDQDGVWNREELENYAALYQKATGKALDVDKLMETYDADGSGTIAYSEQEAMKKNNALGMDDLLSLQASLQSSGSADSTSGSSGNASASKVDRYDLLSFVNANTYSYGSSLRLSHRAIDQNSDGIWNREELTAYADGYQKVTGQKIDVDSIMKNYADEDGNINWKNQQAIQDRDLLGLGRLATLRDESNAKLEKELAEQRELINEKVDSYSYGSKKNDAADLSSWLDTLSGAQKMSLSRSTFFSEQNSFLLSSMVGGNSAMFAFNNLIGEYNNAKMYASVSNGQNWGSISGTMMNSLI